MRFPGSLAAATCFVTHTESVNPIDTLTTWLDEARSAVFFGGAGVSTASGIPDFRSAAGLYASQSQVGRPPEYLLSHDCLADEPEAFFAFHRANLVHPQARPNPAHLGLARLEAQGRLAAVITQNIDGLHQLAGSRVVHELHGSVARNHCLGADQHRFALAEIPEEPLVPICPRCGAMVRPDVVLYGEALDEDVVDAAIAAIRHADVVLVGGTSLAVYPAAGLLRHYRDERLALVNLGETPMDDRADLVIRAPIDEVVAEVCRRLFGSATPATSA